MTALQQTYDDMLQAQYQQQRLCHMERRMHHDEKTHPMQLRVVRLTIGTKTAEIRRCQSLLSNSTAANDEPTSGEAA